MSNLATRTVSGSLFVIVTVAAILAGAVTFVLLFAAVSAVCVWEFCTLVNKRRDLQANRMIATAAAVYIFLATMAFATGAAGFMVFVPYLITTIYLLVSELYLRSRDPLGNIATAFASQLYIAIPVAAMNLITFRASAPPSLGIVYAAPVPLGLMVFLWANDMGAYCVGSALGRYAPQKLFPSVSPHKTWIGSIGGALLTMAAAAGAAILYPSVMPMWQWIGMAATVVVFGTWGDLVESRLKRTLGVKDSGRFLPGHGGALDRFDSMLLATPAVTVYFYTVSYFL